MQQLGAPEAVGDEKMLKQRIGDRLRMYRTGAGFAQDALARKCGVTRAQICNIEGGKTFPSWPLFYRLAKALHRDPRELLP